ncbi:MAG: 4Fe-4S binding protein [Deltaproteobacteria bacterium]|nr:4Fe-4S binding protein [Deltaproteobacteria bacterium]
MARKLAQRPEVDRARCDACGLCFVACPEGAMALDHDGFPLVDDVRCGGCLACARACPVGALGVAHAARCAA